MTTTVVLVPSPIVGAATWLPVAAALNALGIAALIAPLEDDDRAEEPYWRQHARSAAAVLASIDEADSLVLVAHSGAGPLLPAISEAAGRRTAGYLFVDAGLPVDGLSRLETMQREDAQFAANLRALLDAGQRFPSWTDASLRDLIPDERVRRETVADLRPRGAAFFNEPLPVFAGWPDAPCTYLQFSAAYDQPANAARARGWPVESIAAGHFHMLVDPDAVAAAIVRLATRCGLPFTARPSSLSDG